MNRSTFLRSLLARRGGFALTALGSAGLVAAFASCAENEKSPDGDQVYDGSAYIPDASEDAQEADARPADSGGCDAADPSCVSHVVSCDEVDWCTADSGISPFHTYTAIWGSSKNDVWATGSGGTIAHFDGAAWKMTTTGVKNTFFAVWGSSASDVYATSSSMLLLHSKGFADGDARWTRVPAEENEFNSVFITAIWGSSASDVRIGGRAFDLAEPESEWGAGDMYTRSVAEDGGVGWTPRVGTTSVYGIWGSSASDVWLVGDNAVYVKYQRGNILHGTPRKAEDGGIGNLDPLEWKGVDSQVNVVLRAVWGSSADDVWTVGDVGTVRRFQKGDVRFQPITAPTYETLNGLWGSGPNDVWIVGDTGTILHWNGAELQSVPAQFPIGRKPNLYGVWGSAPNDVWIVGDAIALHYTGPKAPQGTP